MVLTIRTNGNTDIVDITDDVASLVAKGKVKDGIAALFVKGSTASLTTIEADGNLYEDFRAVLEKIAPMDADWQHHKTWGDDNGGAHIRAAIIGPSVCIPIVHSKLNIGKWQRIVLVDFDTSPRIREISVYLLA